MAGEEKSPYALYIDAWKRRRHEEEKTFYLKQEERRRKAREGALFLAKRYMVKKVVLFGSSLKGRFSDQSDIDLAVSGLTPKDYFKAWVEVEELIGQDVDLKPLERCQRLLRNEIERWGEVLYEE